MIHIPQIDIWMNRPMDSWHHGERVDPKTWPWYVLCRFSHVRIAPEGHWVHKQAGQIGFCHEKPPCRPGTVPEHWETERARVYERFYLYTRKRAYDVDIRIMK